MTIAIEPARREDEAAVFALLEQQHLPLDGLRDHLSTTLVARPSSAVVMRLML